MTNEERNSYINTKIDATTTVKDAGPTSFVQWLLKKVDGQQHFNPTVAEISGLALSYPGRSMDDDRKIELMQKVEGLGLNIRDELPKPENQQQGPTS